jgi:transcriptional regulator with XRE-family HTH domain/mannose-6-phosphate isomerase-like protein (cupin superfamily)
MVKRLQLGERLRAARQHAKLSLRELAASADVSASLLSQIENGKVNPTVMSMYNIAAALGLTVDYFFTLQQDDGTDGGANGASDETEGSGSNPQELSDRADEAVLLRQSGAVAQGTRAGSESSVSRRAAPQRYVTEQRGPDYTLQPRFEPIVRRAERATIELMDGVIWARLTPGPEMAAEFLEVHYPPGASSGPAMSHHVGREFQLVLAGILTLELAFERYTLYPGDSIIFDSTIPHRLINHGIEPMRAISVVLNS